MASLDQHLKIVVSYRRTDSAMAGRTFDRLARRFGKSHLFIDIDNIPYGVDFRESIDKALHASDLVIPLIGPNWLGPRSQKPSSVPPYETVDEVNAKLDEADAKLKACLGENWTRRRFNADEQTAYSYEVIRSQPGRSGRRAQDGLYQYCAALAAALQRRQTQDIFL